MLPPPPNDNRKVETEIAESIHEEFDLFGVEAF